MKRQNTLLSFLFLFGTPFLAGEERCVAGTYSDKGLEHFNARRYRKEITHSNQASKNSLIFSGVGSRGDGRKTGREVGQDIAENVRDAGYKVFNSNNASSVTDKGSVQSELKASVAKRKVPASLVITYNDMHPFHGGTTIVIRGSGRVERQARSRKESKAVVTHTTFSQRRLLQLVQLLIRLKAWNQRTPNRRPVPDESRATLTIEVNGQTSESWEWFNEMSKNNRLMQVKAKMLALK